MTKPPVIRTIVPPALVPGVHARISGHGGLFPGQGCQLQLVTIALCNPTPALQLSTCISISTLVEVAINWKYCGLLIIVFVPQKPLQQTKGKLSVV